MNNKKFQLVYQTQTNDCGLACLEMIFNYYNADTHVIEKFKERVNLEEGMNMFQLRSIAEKAGFNAVTVKIKMDKVRMIGILPCILHWQSNHYVVLYKIKKMKADIFFHIADPAIGFLVFCERDFYFNFCRHEENGAALILTIEN